MRQGPCSFRLPNVGSTVAALFEPQAPDSFACVGLLQCLLRAEGTDGALRGGADCRRMLLRMRGYANSSNARLEADPEFCP